MRTSGDRAFELARGGFVLGYVLASCDACVISHDLCLYVVPVHYCGHMIQHISITPYI